MNESIHQLQASNDIHSIITRIGYLTRTLRNSLQNLGLDDAIMEAAAAIPDARDRLDYVINMTAQAAERSLNAVDIAQPLQQDLEAKSTMLKQQWDDWFAHPVSLDEAKVLVAETRLFLAQVPETTKETNAQLVEVMMAQDFQDLTGQVIKRIMAVIQEIESQLVSVLMEHAPEQRAPQTMPQESLLNGPQINPQASGVVASQAQVDDLLDSLGF